MKWKSIYIILPLCCIHIKDITYTPYQELICISMCCIRLEMSLVKMKEANSLLLSEVKWKYRDIIYAQIKYKVNTYLYFLLFLAIWIVKIVPRERQELVSSTRSMPWLLMTKPHKGGAWASADTVLLTFCEQVQASMPQAFFKYRGISVVHFVDHSDNFRLIRDSIFPKMIDPPTQGSNRPIRWSCHGFLLLILIRCSTNFRVTGELISVTFHGMWRHCNVRLCREN